VRINCAAALQPRAKRLCEQAGADMTRVTFYNHPTNDAWCRDHGPIFVKNDRSGEVAVTDWVHNAWGGKYPPYDLDNKIPPSIATKLGMRRFENDMILEGGSIDVNGQGLLLTTEACLLHPNRNPKLNRSQIEQALRDMLGVHTILWLGDGIVGDDTDGHIDDLSRFYRDDGIVTVVETNRRDKNHRILQENLERLRSLRTPARQEIQTGGAADAEAVLLRRAAAPGQLREFSHHQRCRAHARVPAAEKGRRGGRGARCLFPQPSDHSHRLFGTGVGTWDSPLHLSTTARLTLLTREPISPADGCPGGGGARRL
jgi:hypothetical protein